MILQLDLETHKTLDDARGFLAGNAEGTALVPDCQRAYAHLERVLRRFGYWYLAKPDKGLFRCYLERTTGLSRAQLTRLIRRYRQDGELESWRRGLARPFPVKFGREDILLLAETDELHGTKDPRFAQLAELSNGHLYNLRRSWTYVQRLSAKQNTRPAWVSIGEPSEAVAGGPAGPPVDRLGAPRGYR